MIRPSRAAGFRENQDRLLVVHEGAGLIEIGAARPAFDGEAVDRAAVIAADDAARATGDLSNAICAEVLNDLVEGGRDGRQAAEPFEQRVAAGDGFAAQNRVAVEVIDWPRQEIALGVGIFLEEPGLGRNGSDIPQRSRAA